MKPKNKKFKRWLGATLILLLLGGGFFLTQASEEFWRLVQIGDDMAFLRGDAVSSVQRMVIDEEGSLGIGTTPSESTVLALESGDKAFLVNNVTDAESISGPISGMMVFDEAAGKNCFRMYQDGAWSDCLGLARRVKLATGLDDGDGRLGDIYYDDGSDQLFVHDGSAFVEISQPVLVTGDTFPGSAREGQLFFNILENQLYIREAGSWILLSQDLGAQMSYHRDCESISISSPNLQFRCPNDKLLTGVYFESNLGTDVTDNLLVPEVASIECCAVQFDPFYWETGPWQACTGADACASTQTRDVRCLAVDGTVANDTDCVAEYEPDDTRSCVQDSCVTYSWQLGTPGACSTTCGEGQFLTPYVCQDSLGNFVSDSDCIDNGAGAKPADQLATCSNCSVCAGSGDRPEVCGGALQITCETANWRRSNTPSPQLGYDGTKLSRSDCLVDCQDWIRTNGDPGRDYICQRHINDDCYDPYLVPEGVDPESLRGARDSQGCDGCENKVCTTDPDGILEVSCESWTGSGYRAMGADPLNEVSFGGGLSQSECETRCESWISLNGEPGQDYTCQRHTNGNCESVYLGRNSVRKNQGGATDHDCDGCQTNFCTATAP